jgi:polyferredoxin
MPCCDNFNMLLKMSIFRYLMQTRNKIEGFLIILVTGVLFAFLGQSGADPPKDVKLHIKNFRYGKDPSVIRCNRGDRLHLTFSTEDTGHSFFIQEFDYDIKVSPARNNVEVFRPSDPTQPSKIEQEVIITAQHKGWLKYFISKSYYRCHVWCGPMHAFEQGKLVISPNTLLLFTLGCFLAIFCIWLFRFYGGRGFLNQSTRPGKDGKDLLEKSRFLRKLLASRWPQLFLMLVAMVMIYIVILTTMFGTHMPGRNLGVLLMWSVWLFIIVAILTPFLGRFWCTICPLPVFGDFLQKRSFLGPSVDKKRNLRSKSFGFSRKWPDILKNDWLKILFFMILATFSTTLVAYPKTSGITILILIAVPLVMASIWDLRIFCTYVCPVSTFVNTFARMSWVGLRSKSREVCNGCKPQFCKNGSTNGWPCPYGLSMKDIDENSDCGLCLECMRSCLYDNVTLKKRKFFSELGTRRLSEAWMTIVIFMLAMVYAVVYLGTWTRIRDFVNIIDKNNWDLFGIYSIVLWTLVLVIVPGLLYFLAFAGVKWSGSDLKTRTVFLSLTGSLIPLGLLNWVAFVIPMLFVNLTFIIQSASDPFGWGWDFFGTRNIPWHQFIPQFIPWIQSGLLLTGTYFSMQNLQKTFAQDFKGRLLLKLVFPFSIFILSASLFMIFFYTN